MRHPLKQLGLVMACLGIGLTASAQQTTGFDVQFKLRTGYQVFGAAKDNLTRRTLGFGVEAGYTFGSGRFGLEVGYQTKPGDQFNNGFNSVDQTSVWAGSGYYVVPVQDYSTGFFTGDVRRNSLEGMAIRLSYETVSDSDWAFRGGIQVGGAKFKHEYQGNYYGYIVRASDGQVMADFLDTYEGVREDSTLSISPFLGLSYKLNEQNSLELNIIGISYKSIDYVHVAGTVLGGTGTYGGNTAYDYVTKKSRLVPHVELGYAFRF